MNFRRYLITFLFFVNIFSFCISFTTADGDKDEQAVPVSAFSGPSSGNLGALLRVIDRDPEIKYLYAKMQAYIVGRIQRAAVGEPRVGDEEEIFEDLLANHAHPHSHEIYSTEERIIVEEKIVKLVKLLNLMHVVSDGDL
jgi:hypothetical protein